MADEVEQARRWLDTVEAALVARAMGTPVGADVQRLDDDEWDAGVSAVAAKFLAVGTPRTLGIVGGGRAAMLLAAQRAYATPRELRLYQPDAAAAEATVRLVAGSPVSARATDLRTACACDIVVVDGAVTLEREWLRAGTLVTVLAADAVLAPAILAAAQVYTVTDPSEAPPGVRVHATLAAVAAGLVDGRQLDELIVLLANA